MIRAIRRPHEEPGVCPGETGNRKEDIMTNENTRYDIMLDDLRARLRAEYEQSDEIKAEECERAFTELMRIGEIMKIKSANYVPRMIEATYYQILLDGLHKAGLPEE